MFLIVVVTVFSGAGGSRADGTTEGVLDGLDFVGTLRATDGSMSLEDQLHFRDGYFWSGGCVRCSFMPGVYWTRNVGNSIAFQGEFESAERGHFTYRGEIKDGQVRVDVHWRRERWYWTVEQDYVFEGEQQQTPDMAALTLKIARQRAAAAIAPTCHI